MYIYIYIYINLCCFYSSVKVHTANICTKSWFKHVSNISTMIEPIVGILFTSNGKLTPYTQSKGPKGYQPAVAGCCGRCCCHHGFRDQEGRTGMVLGFGWIATLRLTLVYFGIKVRRHADKYTHHVEEGFKLRLQ